jgi:hypothetical protein
MRQERLLERRKDADVTARGVERPHHGDQQQRPEIRDRRESQPGAEHEQARGGQHDVHPEPVREKAGQQRQQPRPEQRRGGDEADLKCAVAQQREVIRQQQRDVAVGEGADAARREDQRGIG